ncbi:MAG: peptide chain release factor N(5)-glutamine methyltransferase [Symbiobacteriia bacterium]
MAGDEGHGTAGLPGHAPAVATRRQALAWARDRLAEAGVPDAAWDASLLLAWALDERRDRILTDGNRPLAAAAADRLAAAVARRALREPLQYITGSQGFMGLEFAVDRRVLVPRPDTEVLVEAVLQFMRSLAGAGPWPVADLGTGSGAIAVALAVHDPRLRVTAVELSPAALAVAGANAVRHAVAERVELLQGDMLTPLAGRQFAAIVSNPPYIDPAEAASLLPEVAVYEPAMALFSPAGPLDYYRRLALGAGEHLLPGGLLAVEVGAGQAAAVAGMFAAAWGLRPGGTAEPVPAHLAAVPEPGKLQVRRDYGGVERVVLARRSDMS